MTDRNAANDPAARARAQYSRRHFLGDCGIESLPDDWRERVRVGSDRNQSGTARENLVGGDLEVPKELTEQQKELVNYAAPGLRRILGYE